MYFVENGSYNSDEFEIFEDALDHAYDMAVQMAVDQGIDEEDAIVLIDTFVNGTVGEYPSSGTEVGNHWEAGAGPAGDDCAYWPHVEWRNQ